MRAALEGIGGDSFIAEVLALLRIWAVIGGEMRYTGTNAIENNGGFLSSGKRRIVKVCDSLSVLKRIEAISEKKRTGTIKSVDFWLVETMIRTINRYELEVVMAHAYPHRGVWMNEVADSLITQP